MMKLFVWDFHGVLEKGNENAVIEMTNLALVLHGYTRQMTYKESELLYGKRWHEYFSYLLPEISLEECFKLQSTCFDIQHNNPDIIDRHIQLNDHADSVLEAIHNSEHHQILISNTLSNALDNFIRMLGLEKYFPTTQRFGIDSHNQKTVTKKTCLAEYLKEKDSFKKVVSIGDSPGDMALVDDDLGLEGVGYLYTHPNREHRPAKCHHKIDDLRTVLQEITATTAS